MTYKSLKSVHRCGRAMLQRIKYLNPFRGFGAPGGQNLPFPITLAIGFYNSLYYCTSHDKGPKLVNCCGCTSCCCYCYYTPTMATGRHNNNQIVKTLRGALEIYNKQKSAHQFTPLPALGLMQTVLASLSFHAQLSHCNSDKTLISTASETGY